MSSEKNVKTLFYIFEKLESESGIRGKISSPVLEKTCWILVTEKLVNLQKKTKNLDNKLKLARWKHC